MVGGSRRLGFVSLPAHIPCPAGRKGPRFSSTSSFSSPICQLHSRIVRFRCLLAMGRGRVMAAAGGNACGNAASGNACYLGEASILLSKPTSSKHVAYGTSVRAHAARSGASSKYFRHEGTSALCAHATRFALGIRSDLPMSRKKGLSRLQIRQEVGFTKG